MVFVPILVDLGVLLALITLIGTQKAYTYTLGAAIRALAFALGAIRINYGLGSIRVLGFAADALIALDHTVQHALGSGIENMQAAWNEAASYTAYAIHWVGKEIASLSHDTAQAVEGLALGQVKPWVGKRLAAALATVAVLGARVHALEHGVTADLGRAERSLAKRLGNPAALIAVLAAGAIAWVRPRIAGIERDIDRVNGKVSALYKKLTVAGIIGLIGATIFDQFGLGWLRCRGVNRVGRKLCGLSSVIESLFADAIDVLLVSNLCTLVKFMASAGRAFEPELAYIVSLTDGLIRCQGADRPKDLAVKWQAPPSPENLVAL